GGFREGFEKAGGKVVKELTLPFPNVEFQSLLTEIAALKPDMVFAFFAGGGAVKFVQDYHASGLQKSIPLYGTGFLTDGTLPAQGEAAQGLLTTLHYADGLDTPRDNAFRADYRKAYNMQPDVYAVQGYDAAQLMQVGLQAVQGDIANKTAFRDAMRGATIDSPRGKFTLSPSGNPVQDLYLRQVAGQENKVVDVAVRQLSDPVRGCKLWRALGGPRHGREHLPHPVPERLAARTAAVPGGQRPDADLRHHGHHQPGPRQLLHDRRLHGLRPGAAGGPLAGRRFRAHPGPVRVAGRSARLPAGSGVLQFPVPARPSAAGADDVRADPGLRGSAQPDRRQRRARRA